MNGEEAIVFIGKAAQQKFGLTVTENPAFDPVDPVHKPNSYHYRRLAIDVSGDNKQLTAFNKWVASTFGEQLAELFYDPGINIDNGKLTSPIGGHGGHVHVALEAAGVDWAKVAGIKDGQFGFVQDAGEKVAGVAGDVAGDFAGKIIAGLADLIGAEAAKIALYTALVGGGGALVYYGVATMAGVQEPARQAFGAVAGAKRTAEGVAMVAAK